MSVGHTKPKAPPLIPKTIVVDEDEDNGASEQLLVLCEYMMKEYLNQDLQRLVKPWPPSPAWGVIFMTIRIIWTINSEPAIAERMNKRKFKKTANLFNEYAGITIGQRGCDPPAGVKIVKAVGQVYDDGTYREYPSLTAALKPAPASPKHTFGIPSRAAFKEGKGIVSPTTLPHGQVQWPVRQTSRGKSETRGVKIPENKEVRFANASVRAPSHQHEIT